MPFMRWLFASLLLLSSSTAHAECLEVFEDSARPSCASKPEAPEATERCQKAHGDTLAPLQTLYARADTAFCAHEYQVAAKALEEAIALAPEPPLLYLLAQTYELAGDITAARKRYQDALATEKLTEDHTRKSELALERIAFLAERTPKSNPEGEDANHARVTVFAKSTASDAWIKTAVYLNDRKMGVTPLDLEGLSPGSYTLKVTAKDHEPVVRRFKLESGQHLVFNFAF